MKSHSEIAREIACHHKENLKDGNANGLFYDIHEALSTAVQEERGKIREGGQPMTIQEETPSLLFGKPITEWNQLRLYIEAFRLNDNESMLDIVRRIRGKHESS